MADELTSEHPSGNEVATGGRLYALLAEPEMWAEPDPNGEVSIVAAVAAAVAAEHPDLAREPAFVVANTPANVVAISAARRWIAPFLAGAAAVLLVVAGVAIMTGTGGDDLDVIAVGLKGTPEAPDASATADIVETPLGTRISFVVAGLPSAPEGSYYEAWLRQSPEVGVSAGTFHLRGGDGAIELWAGVGLDDYPMVTVTLQGEGDGAASSGVVVLRGNAG